jgi:hypothetical protein
VKGDWAARTDLKRIETHESAVSVVGLGLTAAEFGSIDLSRADPRA